MKITINPFDANSIKKAQEDLQKFKIDLERKEALFVKRLSAIGLNVAQIKFANADYAGINDVKVHVNVMGSKATIIADGQAVAFIEFGTGVTHPESPLGMFQHGTYGQGKGRQSMWGYYGEAGTNGKFVRKSDKGNVYLTSGNDPAMAMYDAILKMTEQVTNIAIEVFKS